MPGDGAGTRGGPAGGEHVGPPHVSSVRHRRRAGPGAPGPADLRGASGHGPPTPGTRTSSQRGARPSERAGRAARTLEAPGVIPGAKHTLSLGPHGRGDRRGGRQPAAPSRNQREPRWGQAVSQTQPHAGRAWPGSNVPRLPGLRSSSVSRSPLSRETCPEAPHRLGGAAAVREGLRATIWGSVPPSPLSLPPPGSLTPLRRGQSQPGTAPTPRGLGGHLPNRGHGS